MQPSDAPEHHCDPTAGVSSQADTIIDDALDVDRVQAERVDSERSG